MTKDHKKLIGRYMTKDHKKRYFRKMYLNSFHCEKLLSDHKNYYGLNKLAKIILPRKSNNIVELKNYKHLTKVPFTIHNYKETS